MSIINLIVKSLSYLFFTIIVGFFSVLVFVSSMPYNTMTPNYKVKKAVNTLMPEGWSFFTRSPREELADIYEVKGNVITKLTSSNAEPENIFGFSRKSRKVGMELSIVANIIADTTWEVIPKVGPRYIENKKFCKLVLTNNLHHLPSGNYLISRYEPIPWAWAKMSQDLDRKLKVALVSF